MYSNSINNNINGGSAGYVRYPSPSAPTTVETGSFMTDNSLTSHSPNTKRGYTTSALKYNQSSTSTSNNTTLNSSHLSGVGSNIVYNNSNHHNNNNNNVNTTTTVQCYITPSNHITNDQLLCLHFCPCGQAGGNSTLQPAVPVHMLPASLNIIDNGNLRRGLLPVMQSIPTYTGNLNPNNMNNNNNMNVANTTPQLFVNINSSENMSLANNGKVSQQITPMNHAMAHTMNSYLPSQPKGYTHTGGIEPVPASESGYSHTASTRELHTPTTNHNSMSAASSSTTPQSANLVQLTSALEKLELQKEPKVVSIFDSGYDSDEEIVLVSNRLQHQIHKKSFLHINPPVDPTFRPDYNIGHFLREVSLTSALSAEECAIMGGCMRLHRYVPGDVIIRQGDVGRGFYVLKVGLAQVTQYVNEVADGKVVDHITSGEFFGESTLFSEEPRAFSVIALRPCEVLFMHKDDFRILFDGTKVPNPIVFTRKQPIRSRIEEETVFLSKYELKPPKQKYLARDPKVVEMLIMALCKQTVFHGMEHDHRLLLIHHMWYASVPKGTVLIRQGDVGDNMYVLIQGKINVYIRSDDGASQRKVDSFETTGRCFGELALLYNTPRNATVIAKTDTLLWVLDRITYRRIMRNVTSHSLKKNMMVLNRIPLLDQLTDAVKEQVAGSVELQSFKDGDLITKQGDKADGFFFIVLGLVHIVKYVDNAPYIVNQLLDGDFFGERALVQDAPRSASAVAIGPVEIGRIDKYIFSSILAPLLLPQLQNRAKIYAFRDQLVKEQRKDLLTVSSLMVEQQRRKIDILANQHAVYKLEKFTRLGFLGKGGYGYVELVHNAETDETFALKSQYRSHVIRTKSTFNVVNEKKLLTKLRSPHIIRLYATFKDEECLYFLLEPCLGGELFTLQRMRTQFDDRASRFFAASVLLALEVMHKAGVVYRDLKPENLLLDANGYLKVTDFGLSKEIGNARTNTVCGTPHYLAPEVIKGTGHTKAVDLWCLGVLIYEMLAGRPPFYRSGERGDHIKLYKRIVACDYHASSTFTPEAWDLIQRLLQPHEQHRLGYGGGDAFLDIKNHPWFLGFDWHNLSQRTLRAPIIPYLRTPEDTHNFKKENPNYVQPGKGVAADGDMTWDEEF